MIRPQPPILMSTLSLLPIVMTITSGSPKLYPLSDLSTLLLFQGSQSKCLQSINSKFQYMSLHMWILWCEKIGNVAGWS